MLLINEFYKDKSMGKMDELKVLILKLMKLLNKFKEIKLV